MNTLFPDRRRLIRVGCLPILLSAVLPNALYVGHGFTAVQVEDLGRPATAEEHADHCHVAAAKCSGQAVMAGTWSVYDEPVRVSTDGLLYAVPHGRTAAAIAAAVLPADPPPRFV